MKPLTSRDQADRVFDDGDALLFKHNTNCSISAVAHREMESWLAGGEPVPVYLIDIHRGRDISNYVGERTGIEHESPQVILLRGGEPAWSASHFDITAAALRTNVGGTGAA